MTNRQPDNRNSFWLLAWGFLAVQLTVLLFALKRLFERSGGAQLATPQPAKVDLQVPSPIAIKQVNVIDWNVMGFVSAATTLVSAAIFYIAGRVYEAHWYGFYGINVSQLDLSPPQVMVQGIPGILFFILALFLSWGFITFWNLRKGLSVTAQDVPMIIIVAYIVATIGLSIVVTLVMSEIESSHSVFTGFHAPLEVIIAWISSTYILLLALTTYFVIPLIAKWSRHSRLGQGASVHASELRQRSVTRLEPLPFGLGLSLLLLFLLSIAISSIMGEYDARRGIRTLDGNWQIPEIFLYSDEEMGTLPKSLSSQSGNFFKYGPLGLMARNETTLYLIDWSDWQRRYKYFERRPNLYLISRDGKQNLQLFAPSPPTPTPTASPTPRPTMTPSP